MFDLHNKKLLSAFVVVIVLSMFLNACTSNEVYSPEDIIEAEVEEEAEDEDEVTESSGDMYTLKIVTWPGPESEAAQKMVDYFNENKSKEAGFKVEIVLFGRDQLWAKQDAIMAANSDEVDTFFITNAIAIRYLQFLEPLDQFYNDPAVNVWGASPDDFMSGAVAGYRIDDQLWGIPSDVSNHFLYYRNDYIDELLSNTEWQETYTSICQEQMGLELEPKAPEEWTWDDYTCASYFFTQAYNPDSPTEFGNYTQGKVMGPTSYLWTNALWSYGGEWFDEEGNPSFNTDAAKKAQELWTLNWEKGLTPPGSITGEYSEANEALKTGNVALGIQWNAAFNELNAEDSPIHGKIAIVATPAGPSGRFNYNQSIGYGLNKFSSHKEEAASWLLWCSTEEANMVYAESGGVPAFTTVLDAKSDENPMFGALSQAVDKFGRAALPMSGYYQDIVCENLANAWSGTFSVEESLEQLQQECEEEKESRDL